MQNDDDLIALAKKQQAELVNQIGQVSTGLNDLRAFVISTTTDAKEIAEDIIAPKARALINWYKAFMLLASGGATLVGACAILWLNANFVGTQANDAAWGKQVSINETSVKQFRALELATGIKDKVDEEQSRRIESLEQDVREQRRLLKK